MKVVSTGCSLSILCTCVKIILSDNTYHRVCGCMELILILLSLCVQRVYFIGTCSLHICTCVVSHSRYPQSLLRTQRESSFYDDMSALLFLLLLLLCCVVLCCVVFSLSAVVCTHQRQSSMLLVPHDDSRSALLRVSVGAPLSSALPLYILLGGAILQHYADDTSLLLVRRIYNFDRNLVLKTRRYY